MKQALTFLIIFTSVLIFYVIINGFIGFDIVLIYLFTIATLIIYVTIEYFKNRKRGKDK